MNGDPVAGIRIGDVVRHKRLGIARVVATRFVRGVERATVAWPSGRTSGVEMLSLEHGEGGSQEFAAEAARIEEMRQRIGI